jgi:hypothetical protein
VVHPTQQKQSDADIVGQRNYEEKQKKAEGNRIKPVSLKTRYWKNQYLHKGFYREDTFSFSVV